MRDAVKKTAAVTIIRRPIDDENDKEFIELLKKEGIKAYINKKVHAKLIAVDRAVAIASSMNFIVQSSAGQSWEAGIVSVDSTVVESVVNSILKLIERPDSVED
jgi:phosphatidylserine/phosphatidylglycerophosphate/cardiolipin synthase-like enzyme